MMYFDPHYCHKNVQANWLTNENVIWENLFLVSQSFGLARPYFHVKTSSAPGCQRFVYNGAAAADSVETKIRKMKITFFIVNEITWTFLTIEGNKTHHILKSGRKSRKMKHFNYIEIHFWIHIFDCILPKTPTRNMYLRKWYWSFPRM